MTFRPNILWISTHDISPHLGAYAGVWPGAEQAVTPHLDAFADDGTVFDNAFAAAPVCAPSRSAIMTGCYPTAIGTMHMRTKAVPPPEVTLFTEYLRAAGYYATNNWFTDFQVDVPPTAFDECGPAAHWRNRPDDSTPFFAAFHGMATHESQIHLDDESFAAATSQVPDAARHDPLTVELPPYYPDTPVFRTAWARYLDLITEMDSWVGGLLAELDEAGLREDTIVVFWSDHGVGMPRAKRWAHEAGLREPLIVRWPGRIEAGAHAEEIVQLLDLAPSMLTAAGIETPAHMHGTAAFDSDGRRLRANRYAFGARDRMDEQRDAARTVRNDRYRYIRNLHPDRPEMLHADYPDRLPTWAELRRLAFEEAGQLGAGSSPDLLTPLQRTLVAASKPEEELYDIRNDPHETRNLVDDPEHGDALVELRAALDGWLEEHGDLGRIPEEALLDEWRPGGRRRTTEPASARIDGGVLIASCSTPGASLAWTTDPPLTARADPADRLAATIGSPVDDGRRWRLYSEPVTVPAGADVWVGAWRLGYEPAEPVRLA